MPENYGKAERAALIVLALENREVPNPELTKGYGIDLREAGRKRLNKDGLIKTRKEKSYIHKITNDGIDWCERELMTVEAPPRSGPLPRAVFETLRLVLRYGDVWLVDVLRLAGVESSIRVAYRELQTKPRDWVRLAELHTRLNGTNKDDVDRVLEIMTKDGTTHLSPESDRRAVTDADRAAAIRIGSEDKHRVAIEES